MTPPTLPQHAAIKFRLLKSLAVRPQKSSRPFPRIVWNSDDPSWEALYRGTTSYTGNESGQPPLGAIGRVSGRGRKRSFEGQPSPSGPAGRLLVIVIRTKWRLQFLLDDILDELHVVHDCEMGTFPDVHLQT